MGAIPAQSNLGFQAKTQRTRQVLQPASQGMHSGCCSHSGHRGCHAQRMAAWRISVPGPLTYFTNAEA